MLNKKVLLGIDLGDSLEEHLSFLGTPNQERSIFEKPIANTISVNKTKLLYYYLGASFISIQIHGKPKIIQSISLQVLTPERAFINQIADFLIKHNRYDSLAREIGENKNEITKRFVGTKNIFNEWEVQLESFSLRFGFSREIETERMICTEVSITNKVSTF